MGKKIAEVMKKERRNFVAGAKKNGFSTEVAEEVFALIEPFAGYAFNKAHATSYALIAYQTAYLKANYPIEYMTAFLITHAGQLEKVAGAVAECRRLGIKVLPPDINRSQASFSIQVNVEDNVPAICFGLAAIKNVGSGGVEPIITEHEKGGDFKSVEDLCRRCDLRGVNRRVLESLIKVGALDCLGDRGTLLNNIDRVLSLAQREQRLRDTGQTTMFDLWGEEMPVPVPGIDLESADIATKDKLDWERELMGVYLSEHPFSAFAGRAAAENTTLCGQIDEELAGQTVVVAGMVASVRYLFTKDKRPFASAVLEDLDGQVEVMVWPKVYADTRDLWEEGNILLVEAKVKLREERIQLTCDRVRRYQPEAVPSKEAAVSQPEEVTVLVEESPAPVVKVESRKLVISLTQTDDERSDIARLQKVVDILRDFPGQDEVKLCVTNGEKIVNLRLQSIYTKYCPALHQRLVELVGEEGLRLESEV